MRKQRRNSKQEWRRVDLHLHTPASTDFQESNASYLDILKAAEQKGLDIIAFTDHNTVAGYREMTEEIHQLELLEGLGRLRNEEKERLGEYRRLLDKVLALPGFEFTATLGFHILGIFSPETDVRELEFILRQLNIPPDKLDAGSGEVGATTDVLTAYRVIDQAGGIVIAAHANTSHGVAMRGLGFGGQTRIAYTQDPHLHVLEVTDLEKKGRRASSTARARNTRAACAASKAPTRTGFTAISTTPNTLASATG
jgi:PHP family Zn ribbon phosphoesterase